MERLEKTILKSLIYNEEYARKVIPFIKPEYFSDKTEKLVFKEIFEFIDKYKNLPTHESLVINFTENTILTESEVRSTIELLKLIDTDKNEPTEMAWLTDQTEKFCQDRSIYNAIMESVSIIDDKTHKKA
jgi:replicative DNA helicase